LGIILYELLCGVRPYRGSASEVRTAVTSGLAVQPLEVREDVPPELVELVSRCLAKAPEQRPAALEVAQTLGRLLEGPSQPGAAGDSPFRGLSAFSERHSNFFFGREGEVSALLERLREVPVLPIVGPSGAGKSSFIQAGVIPRLREQGPWSILKLRPGDRPFAALAACLQQELGTGSVDATVDLTKKASGPQPEPMPLPAGLATRLAANSGLLNLLLADLAQRRRSRILLFVDQLEEAYTLTPDAATRGEFDRIAEQVGKELAGKLFPADMLDEVLRTLAEMRQAK
jgi:hypothetical protein